MITVDTAVDEPPYEQIRTQIAAQVVDGGLPPGTKLPSVRALAETLGIAANTVARAYRELEHAGVVTTRGRNGTVVNGDGVDRAAKEAAAIVRRRDALPSASGRMRPSSWYDVPSTGP